MIDIILGVFSYLATFLIMAGIYAIFTLGLNIQWGYTGLFNIGIAGFFCIGAYTSAFITSSPPSGEYAKYVNQIIGFNLPFPAGMLGAALVCGIIAFIIGLPTLRLRGDYLAITTIGIAETIRLIFLNENWLANGSRGLAGLPQPFAGWIDPRFYNYVYLLIVMVILMAIYKLIERAIRSPWGRVLRAIREDEEAALMLGKNVSSFKMQALVFGAMIMGIGGSLYVHYQKTVSPDVFTPLYGTFIIWVMLIIGGSGNNKGAVAGGFVVWGLWTASKFLTDMLPTQLQSRAPYFRYLVIGLVLEWIILYRPSGLFGEEKSVSRYID